MAFTEDYLDGRVRLAVLSLGGTIASEPNDAGKPGVIPRLSADQLVASLGDKVVGPCVETITFATVPSSDLTFDLARALYLRIDALVTGGISGIIVTQGTDTMEEMAFLLDLWYQGEAPIIFTGAMIDSSHAGADGVANLINAIVAARHARLGGGGVFITMDDVLHSARWATKRHTTARSAFSSVPAGPVGWFSEARIVLTAKISRSPTVPFPSEAIIPLVANVSVGMGETGAFFGALLRQGYRGVVVQSLGGGHVPSRALEQLNLLADQMPVIICSRTGAGATLTETYSFPGSEMSISKGNAVFSGTLDAPKARVLLTALLMAGITKHGDIVDAFARHANPW